MATSSSSPGRRVERESRASVQRWPDWWDSARLCLRCDPRGARKLSGTGLVSRYTRGVTWTHRAIGVVAVAILAGLPVAGTACALLCDSAVSAAAGQATTSAHHGSGAKCQDPVDSKSVEEQIQAVVQHGCDTHASVGESPVTLTAARADSGVPTGMNAPSVSDTPFKARASFAPDSVYRSRPSTTPPTGTPLVLRV